MPLLKAENKRNDYRLVGVSLPPQVHSYLSLYASAKGTKKASIFKELLLNWIAEQRSFEPDEELIEQVIHRGQLQWKLLKAKNPDSDIRVFKAELKLELAGKGILPKYVDSIMKEIN